MQTSERLCPTADFAGGRSRPKWGGILVMLHDPLLLDVILETRLFSSRVSHGQENVHEAFSGLLRFLIAESISATVVWQSGGLWDLVFPNPP